MNDLQIRVGKTFADTKCWALVAVARAKADETVRENHISFASWKPLAVRRGSG